MLLKMRIKSKCVALILWIKELMRIGEIMGCSLNLTREGEGSGYLFDEKIFVQTINFFEGVN